MFRLASSLRRKSSGVTSSDEASRSPVRKSSLKKNAIWGASGKSPPPKSVLQEAEQKRVEDNSAVKVQSIARGKSARAEVDGKKQQKKEENEAAVDSPTFASPWPNALCPTLDPTLAPMIVRRQRRSRRSSAARGTGPRWQ